MRLCANVARRFLWRVALMLALLLPITDGSAAAAEDEALAVEMRSALSEQDSPLPGDDPLSVISSLPEIRGIMPPIEELPPNRWLRVIIWTALLAGSAVFLLIQWRRYAARIACARALRLLRKLSDDTLTSDEDIKRFYLRLNRVLRNYIQRCYGIHIGLRPCVWLRGFAECGVCRLSRTNMELLADLESRNIGDETFSMIYNLLFTCDLVKFAKHHPSPAEAREALAAGSRFVKELEVEREEGGGE